MLDTKLISTVLEESYKKYKDLKEGKNASYIPYLAKVPSELCGVTVVTVDGDVISFGDDSYGFAIESISKVCTLALAMEEHGATAVREKIGTSPTGLPFNSVMALELHKDKPLSPLVNAGAIATTSLITAKDKEDRWNKILDIQQRLMSKDVVLSDEVNESEQTTNFHNRAISWLLYSAGNMYSDPMEACEVYTRQCSTLVTSKDLATLGVTLANKGTNPITKEQVLSPQNIPHILAEMTMEGLYDKSGEFAYMVGLPGKSGVGGGLIAVVPGKLAIAVFSPPLDPYGNSVRGFKIIKDFCHKMKFNLYTND
ncbi:glutaminase A [Mycoplasma sp. VS30B]